MTTRSASKHIPAVYQRSKSARPAGSRGQASRESQGGRTVLTPSCQGRRAAPLPAAPAVSRRPAGLVKKDVPQGRVLPPPGTHHRQMQGGRPECRVQRHGFHEGAVGPRQLPRAIRRWPLTKARLAVRLVVASNSRGTASPSRIPSRSRLTSFDVAGRREYPSRTSMAVRDCSPPASTETAGPAGGSGCLHGPDPPAPPTQL